MPFCVVCRTAVPNPSTAVLLSASTPEPASLVINAICDSCATLPVPELEEECAAYLPSGSRASSERKKDEPKVAILKAKERGGASSG
jgi:hypothetical protein